MKRIILLIDCASEFDRKLLRGLTRYSKEHDSWLFYRMPAPIREARDGGREIIRWAKKWGADAIVGRWSSVDTSLLSGLGIPVVLQNYTGRSSIFSNLTGDYLGTGEIAAKFFIDRGFKEFAYFGIRDIIWSEERLLGYRREIERTGGRLHTLMVTDAERERGTVVRWAKDLPKPVALFVCDDAYALFLTETCKMENIHIPDEISLLGVDNDELLCQISDPQMSSITLHVEQGGYRLGEMLQKQFDSNDVWSFNIVISPGEIVQRGSTLRHHIRDPYVDRVVRYIDENFDKPITSDQIISQVPLCRRSLEIRFKKEFGTMTLYKYLMECRMDKFARLLETTDLPVNEICDRCGITNYLNVSRSFKKIYGCSPREYRERKKKEHPVNITQIE